MIRAIYSKRAKRTHRRNNHQQSTSLKKRRNMASLQMDLEVQPVEPKIISRYEMPITNLFTKEELLMTTKKLCSFSKEDFEFIAVIAQIDQKFILTLYHKEDTMIPILFDQHAVHERLRLEKLIKDNTNSDGSIVSEKLITPIVMNLEDILVLVLRKHETCFKDLGLEVQIISEVKIRIISVPKCIKEKVTRTPTEEQEETFTNLIMELIVEAFKFLIETQGANLQFPKTIMDVLSSRACRGAIRFGDFVPLNVLRKFISKLKLCKAPFQCAHGRPTLHPLIQLVSDQLVTYNDPDERIKLLKRRSIV